MLAGILLVVNPTVMYGGLTLLISLTGNTPGYTDNPLRHDLWRAGHAHAGVLLVLSLVMLRYVDEAALSPSWRGLPAPVRRSRQSSSLRHSSSPSRPQRRKSPMACSTSRTSARSSSEAVCSPSASVSSAPHDAVENCTTAVTAGCSRC